jgi:hypothetical protein
VSVDRRPPGEARGQAADGPGADGPVAAGAAADRARARSILERLGLAAIAAVMAVVFSGLALAAWIGGEVFLAAMAAIGAFMTVWAAVANLRRG